MTNKETKILVIDDEIDYLEIVADMLLDHYSVETLNEGKDAFEFAKEYQPHLILLDLNMPDFDGAILCRLLKNELSTKDISIIFVTGSDSPEDLVRGFESGADDYLTKPYQQTELIARCNSVLKLQSLTRKLKEANQNLEKRVAEQIEKLQKIGQLQRYFSPKMIESILSADQGDGISFGDIPQRKEVTIFFCDIRDFTALADQMHPEEIKNILDAYLALITEVIFEHQGTINKFLGDGVLAVFGDPVPVPRPALCAIQAATEIKRRLHDFRPISGGMPDGLSLRIGFGIHSGMVVIGNLGVGQHLDYTVIGAAVNMAARLQAFSTQNEVIVTESTYRPYQEQIQIRDERNVEIKGFEKPVKIAEVEFLNTK